MKVSGPGKWERKPLGKRQVILASLIDYSSYADQNQMIIDGFHLLKGKAFGNVYVNCKNLHRSLN